MFSGCLMGGLLALQLCQASVDMSDPGKALRQPHAHFAGWAAWSGRRPEAGGGRSGGLGRALESLWAQRSLRAQLFESLATGLGG